jgi:hypothetical protein
MRKIKFYVFKVEDFQHFLINFDRNIIHKLSYIQTIENHSATDMRKVEDFCDMTKA